MELQELICGILSAVGNAKPKRMFGTYNITLDGANLGIICGEKWYLKKAPPLTAILAERGIELELGIKGESYIITDFSDAELVREMACAVKDYVKSQPRKRRR